MPSLPNQLPDDIDDLKALVAEQAAHHEQLEQENHRMSARVLFLQEQLNLALARRYAASSEKISPDQIRLFNEAEQDAEAFVDEDQYEPVTVPAYTRNKRGRKPLPDTFASVRRTADWQRSPRAIRPGIFLEWRGLKRKPASYQAYYNEHCAHTARAGVPPESREGNVLIDRARYKWQSRCRGLSYLPVAA